MRGRATNVVLVEILNRMRACVQCYLCVCCVMLKVGGLGLGHVDRDDE